MTMADYQLIDESTVKRLADGAHIPFDESNSDYRQYLADVENGAVVLPADPPPIVFSQDDRLDGQVRTTDATPTEVVRITLGVQTGYTGQVNVIGVDNGNGAVRVIRASFAIKRLNGGALAIGAPVVLASHGDAAASPWTIASSVGGNDAIVSVTGAAGRTVDWLCRGQIMSFAPGGV